MTTNGISCFSWLIYPCVISVLLIVAIPAFQYLALAPFGSDIFLQFEILFGLVLFVAFFTLLISPFLIPFRGLRRFALRSFVVAGMAIAAILMGRPLGNHVRMAAFEQLAKRSTPLVQAIRSYELRYATPPSELAVLVPEFLSAVPSTGMAAYPRYKYYSGDKATHYDGNPWVLLVSTPSGMINFDRFMYFPRQNYPKTMHGDSIERVADWAYLHE